MPRQIHPGPGGDSGELGGLLAQPGVVPARGSRDGREISGADERIGGAQGHLGGWALGPKGGWARPWRQWSHFSRGRFGFFSRSGTLGLGTRGLGPKAQAKHGVTWMTSSSGGVRGGQICIVHSAPYPGRAERPGWAARRLYSQP